MKHLLLFLCMISFMASFSYAAETVTDCDRMREDTLRNNPKLGLETVKSKTRTRGATAQ